MKTPIVHWLAVAEAGVLADSDVCDLGADTHPRTFREIKDALMGMKRPVKLASDPFVVRTATKPCGKFRPQYPESHYCVCLWVREVHVTPEAVPPPAGG